MTHRDTTIMPFPQAARVTVCDTQMRANLNMATASIGARRAERVSEIPHWEGLREQARQVKAYSLRHLSALLEELEKQVVASGGQVHWAKTADDACAIAARLITASGAHEVVKVKSMTTEEIGLNEYLGARGIQATETDLAELIIQLAEERPTHIVVPSIHLNRAQIKDLFRRKLSVEHLTDEPEELAAAARAYLRRKFLYTEVAVSGANFLVADSGAVGVVESEGNGRMCLTLPKTLITIAGIEKIVPRWSDLAPFLQLLPRSATGERMNPYTSFWTGKSQNDGPEAFHLILLDNGRSGILADPVARQTLNCIRCGACLNVCPVYRRAGGHAYQSAYSGPIGAILAPQLWSAGAFDSLPYASTLCGACAEACPVKIDIPEILVELRARAVEKRTTPFGERAALGLVGRLLRSAAAFRAALALLRMLQAPFRRGRSLRALPPPFSAWTRTRDFPAFTKDFQANRRGRGDQAP